MKRIRKVGEVIALAAMLFAGTAMAAGGGAAAVRKQVENSMLVSGQVDIEPDGSVSSITLDREDKLPSGVVSLVQRSALQWQFEPLQEGGAAVTVRAPMNVRVVARQLDDGDYEVSLRGASFARYDGKDKSTVGKVKMRPPSYPEPAWKAGASGVAYLLLKVEKDGSVGDVIAEQVNLQFIANEGEMNRFRQLFARNALAAARNWTFRVPEQGEAASQPYWIVRVPVHYSLRNPKQADPEGTYGRWASYVPGPRQQASWASDGERAGFSPDALGEDGVYMANDRGPRLLTPLQGG